MMLRLKAIGDWLGIRHPEDTGIFFTTRRAVLYTRILMVTALAVFITLIKDVIDQGFAFVPLVVFFLSIVIFVSIVLNRNGRATSSKVIFLLLMNLVIGLLCSVVPPERLAFVYFFPLLIMAFVIFEDHQKAHQRLFIGVSATMLLLLVSTDFKLFWDYQLSVSELGQKNMVINIIVTIVIITLCVDFLIRTNKRAEESLKKQATFIAQQNLELKKINAELDRFVYSASHDLRAPLVSIQGLSKLAIAESQSEIDRKYFKLINDRVIRLDDFIRDIIEYSRNARTERKLESFSLNPMINEVIENLKYMEGADRITFSVCSNVEEVHTDKSRLKVVLSNIISNAIKYHNLRQDNPNVEIVSNQLESTVCIRIKDNGIGIPEEAREKIFDMFYRASDRAGGSGLGLYIVKEIVEKLEGSITVSSVFGEGTTFEVRIPVQLQV
ncbi:MAG: ATP-binding protein [Cyclobacteriaceae bacterium]|nr:MAG: ATP-binding protein [Cyclobacteriaceae bacterium]